MIHYFLTRSGFSGFRSVLRFGEQPLQLIKHIHVIIATENHIRYVNIIYHDILRGGE